MNIDGYEGIYTRDFAGNGGGVRKYMNDIRDTYIWRGSLRGMMYEGGEI